MSDRYLKIVLTVIAVELFWLGVKDIGTPVAAQATTPVIIRGVELPKGVMVPIQAMTPVSVVAERPLAVSLDGPVQLTERPLSVSVDTPLRIQGPVEITATKPIPTEAAPYIPSTRPGE